MQHSFFEEFSALINPPEKKLRSRGKSATDKPKEKAAAKPREKHPSFTSPCDGCSLTPYKRLLTPYGNLQTCKVIVLLDMPTLAEATGIDVPKETFQFYFNALSTLGIAPNDVAFIYAVRCACHDKEPDKTARTRCGSYLTKDLLSSPCKYVLCASLLGIKYMFAGMSLKTYRGRVLEFQQKTVVVCQEGELCRRDPIQATLFNNDIKRLGQVISGKHVKPDYKYNSLTNPEEIVQICKWLKENHDANDPYGWDIETMWLRQLEPYAVDPYSPHFRIWQMAFSWDDYTAVGFPFDPDPELVKKYNLPTIHSNPEILHAVKDLLENCKVTEHTKFDTRCIYAKYGIDVGVNLPLQHFEDTHAMNYLVNPEDLGGNDLKHLAWEHTAEGGYEAGIGFVDSLEEYDWEKNVHYNCHDTDLTRRIRKVLLVELEKLQQLKVYEQMLKPFSIACLHMEWDGFQMDEKFLKEQQDFQENKMKEALAQFSQCDEFVKFKQFCTAKIEELKNQVVGKTLNAKDTKQYEKELAKFDLTAFDFKNASTAIKNEDLILLLYTVLKIPITKQTENEQPSTEADILEANEKKFPGLKHILAYKQAQKLYSTYISPYLDGKLSKHKVAKLERPPYIKYDGRVHPMIITTRTSTGRTSCVEPNGQNIKNEYSAKRPFISRFPGGSIISPDYSQAEIRIAAVQCNDPQLIRALRYDIHTVNLSVIEKITTVEEAKAALSGSEKEGEVFSSMCKQTLKKLYSERTPDKEKLKFYEKIRRTIAKKFMFGPMYGQTENGIVRQLIEELGVNKREAEQDAPIFLDALRNLYPTYFKWAASNVPTARANNYVESIFGRRRPLNYVALLNNLAQDDKEIRRQLGGLDRKVTNTKVQGPASDLCLYAALHMIEIFKNRRIAADQSIKIKLLEEAINSQALQKCIEKELITEAQFDEFISKCVEGKALSRVVLVIHDNIPTDSPKEEVIPAVIVTDTVMRFVPSYYLDTKGVPFSADIEIGPNLGELKPFEL